MVKIGPGKGLEVQLQSSVEAQFGRQIRALISETLEGLGIKDAHVDAIDKGALDCTIRARVESAAFRSAEIKEEIPWLRHYGGKGCCAPSGAQCP